MKKLRTWLLGLLGSILLTTQVMGGTWTANEFLYKPDLGARGVAEKSHYDTGLDRIDARLGKTIWVGDPNYGPTLQDAVTAIGSNNAILRIPTGTHAISADLTIPANITLKIEQGAILSIADTRTLTINGSLDTGPYQIFSCIGTGKVGFGKIKDVSVEWWGSGYQAINAAITAVNSAGGGTVSIYTDQTLAAPVNLKSSTYLEGRGVTAPTLTVSSAINAIQISGVPGARLYACGVNNLKLAGSGGALAGVTVTGVDYPIVKNLKITGFTDGLQIAADTGVGVYYGNFEDLIISQCTDGVEITNSDSVHRTNVLSFRNVHCNYNSGNGFSQSYGTTVNYISCSAEQNNGVGFKFVDTVAANLIGGYAENNTAKDLDTTGQTSKVNLFGFKYSTYQTGGNELRVLEQNSTIDVWGSGAGGSFIRGKVNTDANWRFYLTCDGQFFTSPDDSTSAPTLCIYPAANKLLFNKYVRFSTTNGNAGTFTCDNDATTIVNNTSITANSLIYLQPTNDAAATLQGSTKCLYIYSKSAGSSFTVKTADATAAEGTETFNYWVIN
jgi:hypothetical protein